MDSKEATHEYLAHLKNRAQAQLLLAPSGKEDIEPIIEELNDLSNRIHAAYVPLFEAMRVRNGQAS